MRASLLCLFAVPLLGCSSAGASRGPSSPSSPPARQAQVVEATPAPEVQPEPASVFAREARADLLLGRIGMVTAAVRGQFDRASQVRDVVLSACLRQAVEQLEAIERDGIRWRGDLRDAAFEGRGAAEGAWATLQGLEASASRARTQANSCVGMEVGYVGGETKSKPRELEGLALGIRGPTSRLADLEARVDALKGTTHKTHARMEFSKDSVKGKLAAAQGGQMGPAPAGPQAAPPKTPQGAAAAARRDSSMLLRSAQLTLAVYEVEQKIEAVERAATELGGYMALRSDRQITVRIPKERFDEAIRRVEKLGDVLHRSVAAEDVTDQYVDLELRLRNAQLVRGRLEKLLEHATVRDAIEIQKELAKVTEEMERLEGKLKLLRDRIAFSTLTVSFERTAPQRVRSQALLPFPWMRKMGLTPLLEVPR